MTTVAVLVVKLDLTAISNTVDNLNELVLDIMDYTWIIPYKCVFFFLTIM